MRDYVSPQRDTMMSLDSMPWSLLDALPDGLAVLRADGAIGFLNAAWEAHYQAHPGVVDYFAIGNDFCDAFKSVYASDPVDVQMLSEGVPAVLTGLSDQVTFACPLLNAGQLPLTHLAQRWMHFTIVPYTLEKSRGALVQQRIIGPCDAVKHCHMSVEQAIIKLEDQVVARTAEVQLLQKVVANAPDGIGIITLDGDITYANPAFQSMLGYGAELMGTAATEVYDAAPEDITDLIQHVITHEYWQGTVILRRKDGTTFHGQLSALRICDDDGRPQAVAGIIRDITERKAMEEALRSSEERYRTLVRNFPDGAVFLFDHDLRYLAAGGAALEAYGIDAAGLIGKTLHDAVSPENQAQLITVYRAALAGQTVVIELVAREQTYLVKAMPIKDVDGTIVSGMIISLDITERKRAEQALQVSEARLHHLVSSSPVVIYSCRATGDFGATFMSENVTTHFGYEPHQFTGSSSFWAEHIHPDDAPHIFANLQRVFDYDEYVHEYRFLHQDGTYRWVHDRLRLIRDATGQPVEMVGSWKDITERKRAELALQQAYADMERRVVERTMELSQANQALQAEIAERKSAEAALRQSEEQFRAFFEEAPVGIGVSRNGTTLMVNPAFLHMFGYNQCTEVIDTSISNFIAPGERQVAVERAIRRSRGEVVETHFELTGLRQDGTSFPSICDVASIVLMDGQPASVAFFMDITEQKQAEMALASERASLAHRVAERTSDLSVANAELARAVRAKDEFLANMSHELRTPLNSILGLCEGIQEGVYGPITTRQRTIVGMVEESGRHLLTLINDILDLAKVEAGKAELDMTIFAPEPVCQASLRMIKQMATKKRITVDENLDSAVTLLRADERRLKQILVNLLSNAVKFTPERGMVGLEVVGDREQQVVHFTVWDTGIGIPQDKLDRLFKPFVQVDGGLNRSHEGTGLGLALVSRLTELHGGSVTIAGEPGQGSRFTVSLPWQQFDMPVEPATDLNEPSVKTVQGRQLRQVFLVEDSPASVDQIRRYLDELDIVTTTVNQGDDVVQQALELHPDLIILDLLLPGVSGWDILTALKAHPQARHIPVLVVSVVEERARGQMLGATGYLVKPFSRQDLYATLGKIFPSDSPAFVQALAEMPLPAARDSAPLILLAEDNEQSSTLVSDYLISKGYRVLVARNGAEVIAYARETQPALILMDVQMPGVDGLEATRTIRADADVNGIPIIALTALTMPGDRERCLEAGADDYLSKPVSLRQLVQTVEEYL
ncbi:MAG: PAS domain S-box protein [Chloroflexaceae bacterium]